MKFASRNSVINYIGGKQRFQNQAIWIMNFFILSDQNLCFPHIIKQK